MASSSAPNQASAGHLLELIRSGRATNRGELQRATGLSRSTVGHRLEQLFGAGWVREGTAGPSPGGGAGGRPAARLEFDPTHAVVLAADLETRHARAAVLDLGGRMLAEHSGPLLVDDGPEAVLDGLAAWFAALLDSVGAPGLPVCGVGLSVPGPVEFGSGTVVQPPMMPGWDGFPIPDGMRRALAARIPDDRWPRGASGGLSGGAPLPVLVDNDANLIAYAEQRAGHPDCTAFLLVKASTGIGAGMVVNGGIYRGIDGGAGDIGHVRLDDRPDALCRCGSYGCLAAVASGWALAAELTAAGVPAASGSDVHRLLAAGHPAAVRAAQQAGRRVGEVLGTAVTLLNPGVLMFTGDLAGPAFLAGVREELYQRAMPRTTAHLQVVTAAPGDTAGLAGAAALVVEELYAPHRADARLAEAGAPPGRPAPGRPAALRGGSARPPAVGAGHRPAGG